MTDFEPDLLNACAIILDYPDFKTVEAEISAINEQYKGENNSVNGFLDYLKGKDIIDLQSEYVDTFDLSSTPLFLTAWEFGDSRNRGPELMKLKKMIESNGFRIRKGQIPDYIPLLLSFVSAMGPENIPDDFESRLHRYFETLSTKLHNTIYGSIFLMLSDIFQKRMPLPEIKPEKADSGEMPFPLRYNGEEY
ncbi:MAG: nitrate reductase molybdenum cofactor assembly chaperone [Thermoplasmataceae archaeon]